MHSEAIGVTVQSLRTIFTIVMALSLGEAFKQVVADRATNEATSDIELFRPKSLISLVAMLFLIIPFHHGMFRYFADVYPGNSMPQAYAWYIIWDSFGFTTEAGLFFIMSRSLLPRQWKYFYGAVLTILIIDTLWGTVVYFWHRPTIAPWLVLNLGSFILFLALVALGNYYVTRRNVGEIWVVIVGCLLMVVRTVVDYATNWDFYFPQALGPAAAAAGMPDVP